MNNFIRLFAAALALGLAGAAPLAAAAAGFMISANGLADNAMLTRDMAFDKTNSEGKACGGTNRAPGFSWANAPANTQSFAILEQDPDGRGGLGVSHWVLYNIPATATSISTAEIAAAKYTPGRGTGDLVGYRGPCAPAGDAPHHYIVTLYALGAPPAFPAGLDRDGVFAAMQGKILGATTTIMRYQALP